MKGFKRDMRIFGGGLSRNSWLFFNNLCEVIADSGIYFHIVKGE